MRLDQWDRSTLHQGQFIADKAREMIIERIRWFVAQKSSPVHMRVLGRRGIGKTRVVMEALKPDGIRERVIYSQDPDSVPPEFWAWLRERTNVFVPLVVDEADETEASKLKGQADACEGRVRLITIGIGERFLEEASPSYLYLERLDDESIRKLLLARFLGLSPEQIAWIARLTAGYVKLAVACGEVLAAKPEVDITKITEAPGVHPLLEQLLPEPRVRIVMQALSLLVRVGFEEEVAGEGKALANFVGVPGHEFSVITEQMHRKGLVGKKGRYRYVTPDLLASWLAADLWQARTDDVRALVGSLPSAESREAFLERLKDLGVDEKVRNVSRQLLSHQFRSIEQLDSTEGSKLLYTLTLADPQSALEVLERLVGTVSPERLRSFSCGRRHVIMALDYLKWFKDTFLGAARLLLALAEAENESWANNATGTWTGLFRLRLGGTEVPALDRLPLIEKTLTSGSAIRKQLALKALATLMSPHEVRFSSSETAGAQPVPKEWHPSTWEEIWTVYRSGLMLLDRAMEDSEQSVAKEARDVLLSSTRTVIRVRLPEEIITRLERFSPRDEDERRKARETLRIILEYENERLNEDQRKRLMTIEEKLTGTDFHDRLRRWTGQWSFGDWDIQKRDGGPPAQNRAAALAEEALNRPEELRAELNWLASDEARNVAYFAKRLGELDRNHYWLSELIAKTRDGGRPILLSSYLWGRSVTGDKELVENLLDEWIEGNKNFASVVLTTTLYLEPSKKALQRLLELVKKGWLHRKELSRIAWSVWTEKLPTDAYQQLIICLMFDHSSEVEQAALYSLDCRLKLFPYERTTLAPLAWQLLDRSSAAKGTMPQYYWGEVSKHYVESDPVRIAQAVLKIYEDPEILLDKEDPPMQTLAKASTLKPTEVWNIIAAALLRKDKRVYGLLLGLTGWYVELFSVDRLLEWADEHAPEGARLIANLTKPSGTPLSTLPRQLLIRFGKDEYVRNALDANFQSGSFTGSMTNWLRGELETARVWTNDPHPSVRGWACEIVDSLNKRIQEWEKREQEELG